jgi:hypothetical protein
MARKILAAFAAAALALGVGAAKASTVTFIVSGTLASGAGGTLSGTITIDVNKLPGGPYFPAVPPTDLVPAIDVNYSGALSAGPFTIVNDVTYPLTTLGPREAEVSAADSSNIFFNRLFITFPIPDPSSPFVGASIIDGSINPCNPATCAFEAADSLSGSITTPLPAALPLFATGIGGLGLLGWRRKRKA